jgi:hypothetical protein
MLPLFLGIESLPTTLVSFSTDSQATIPCLSPLKILLQALDLNSFDKYIYSLYHQWLATF